MKQASLQYLFFLDMIFLIPAEISSLAKSKHVIQGNPSIEVFWPPYTQYIDWTHAVSGCRLPLRTSWNDCGSPKLLHADLSGHWAYLVYMAILLLYAMRNARTPKSLHACTQATNESLDSTVMLVFSKLVSPFGGEMFSGEDIFSLLWPVCISYINGYKRH